MDNSKTDLRIDDCIGDGAQTNNVGAIKNTIAIGHGRFFDYRNPTPDQIFIEDIAKALSNQCRYNGHCNFYSVAEHSVNCATLALECGYPQYIQFHALMHDAAEAYTGDMPKPLKLMMPEFQAIEAKIEKVVETTFKINVAAKDLIKRFDIEMLKKEKESLFPSHAEIPWFGFDKINDVNIPIQCLTPKQAETLFIMTFNSIALPENRNE